MLAILNWIDCWYLDIFYVTIRECLIIFGCKCRKNIHCYLRNISIRTFHRVYSSARIAYYALISKWSVLIGTATVITACRNSCCESSVFHAGMIRVRSSNSLTRTNFPNVWPATHLSFSMNLMKSRLGGLGKRPMQEQRESSSEPNPVYGGHSRFMLGAGSPL